MTKPSRKSADLEPPNQLQTDWTDGQREDSLNLLFKFAYDTAKEAINWYWGNKRKKNVGQTLRLLAILLTAMGGLVPPLLAAEIDRLWILNLRACIALDKFFGFSSTWIRFVTTATTIQTGLTRFQLEWSSERAKLGGKEPPPEVCATLIERLLGFLAFVRDEIEKETNAWAAEYLTNLAAIEKEAKRQIEAQTPGGIDVTISNGDEADSPVTISLDSAPMQTVQTPTCTLRPVYPGQHVVGARSTIGGAPVHASSGVIVVGAGQVTKVRLTLQ